MSDHIETRGKPETLPSRDEIDDRHKWQLSDIYADNENWQKDFDKARELIQQAPSFAGQLDESPEILYNCLKMRSDLSLLCFRLYQYAKLNRDIDSRVSEYQAMTERAATLGAQAAAAFSFVEPELLKMDEARLRKLASEFERTDEYDFYIEDLIRSRQHVRSEEVEQLLAEAASFARGPETIFDLLNDADLDYGTVVDEAGNEVVLTKQRFARYMEYSDRRLRRDSFTGVYSAYRSHANSICAALNSSIQKDAFYARARRFESALEAALDAYNIPVQVYHSLLETTADYLEPLHRYVGLRKELLELDEVRTYDLMVPLVAEKRIDIPYFEAVQKTIEAVRPLGEDYGRILREGFESRWVDVFESEGKTSGAFSWGSYGKHPFVLMNYSDTIDNMFTLAHEMGHALHSYLSGRTQPFAKHQYSIFVAEVASTLNEGLLLDYLLKQAKDRSDRMFLLNRYLDNTVSTFYNQVLYAQFELQVHEFVEKGGALSPDQCNRIWHELTEQYFGPELVMDDLAAYKWARIPHYYSAYYVYQYATSYAASQAILDRFLEGEEGLIEKYLELLGSGGSAYPIDQLKRCGVDMTTPEPVEANLKLFSRRLEEMRRLAEE